MKKLIIIAIAILLTAAVVVGVILVFPNTHKPGVEDISPSPSEEPETIHTFVLEEPVIANMKDSNGYVQASILLEITKEKDHEYASEHDYMIIDTVISILRTITETQYLQDDIQDILREKLKYGLIQKLGIDSIKNVYFLEFIIQ